MTLNPSHSLQFRYWLGFAVIKLNDEAEDILRKFCDRPTVTNRDQRQTYRDLESAYNRFLRIFLLAIQEVLSCFSPENLDDIELVVSSICESLHWAKRSLLGEKNQGYRTVNYTLGTTDKTLLREAYDLVLFRLTSSCQQGVFLDNALIRLSGAYNLASGLVKVADAISFTRSHRDVLRRNR